MASCKYLVGVALAAGIAACSSAAPDARGDCIDLSGQNATATLSGHLAKRSFAGPPNYSSIANGDAEEMAYILELDAPACAFDGTFIDDSTPFATVHVSAHDGTTLDALESAVGRDATVSGEAFGGHTGHHHAPLVLLADRVELR